MLVLLLSLFGFSAGALADQTVLFLGDSLTDGYGVQRELAYPALLEKKWQAAGKKVTVVNGAESGSLASSLPERIAFYNKRFKPSIIVIATGGNDGRQLTPVTKIEESLAETIKTAKGTGAK